MGLGLFLLRQNKLTDWITGKIQSCVIRMTIYSKVFQNATAGFRALFGRLIFQSLTYKTEFRNYNQKQIPVLIIMTSNVPEDFYAHIGYDVILQRYQGSLSTYIGPTKI